MLQGRINLERKSMTSAGQGALSIAVRGSGENTAPCLCQASLA